MRGSVVEIYKVFDGSSKRLVIPVYQRNYDWSTKHCGRMFDDLENIVREHRKKHFFGAIVGNSETSFTYVVIDGQQRLTTTSLLMLALVKSLDEGTITSTDTQLSHRIRSSYLVLKDENDEIKFKLKPVKDDNTAYIRLLTDDVPIEKSAVTANYRYFLDRISRTDLTGDEIWEAIQRLEVMLLDLEPPQDDPQRIFESINSTGLELSEADKIRNAVLMGVPSHEQEDLYENFWNRIEKSVDYRTDWFIRLYLISKTGKTPRQDGVYEAFREYQQSSGHETRTILDDMRSHAEYSHKLNTASTGIAAADRRLRRFNIVKHDVTLPLLMPLLGDVEAHIIGREDFTSAVRILDTYIFRRFVCGVPTSALNKIFATAYSETRRLRGDTETTFSDVLTYSLRRRTASGRFPDDAAFEDAFKTRDFYNIKPENRTYLFECLENTSSNDTHDIAAALENQAISVEHIMPRTLTPQWRDELGPDHEEIHATWIDRIGNLTVTGYNSAYSNDTFTSKRTRPNGFEASPYRLNATVKSSQTWTPTQMRHRTEELTSIALEYWPLPETDFVPSTPPLTTVPMGDTDTFTTRVITSFEFEGTKKTVTSWKVALVEVLRLVVQDHREEVFAWAETATGVSQFEGPPEDLTRDEALVVPGLKVWTASSTRSKLSLLRRLFDHLDLDTDELLITLRNNDDSIADSETQVDDAPPEPYAELTKFLPQLTELASVSSSKVEIDALHAEFSTVFTQFDVTEPQLEISGKTMPQLEAPAFVDSATPTQIMAALALMHQIESVMPGLFYRLTVQGTLARWLTQLARVGQSANPRISEL